MAEIVLGIRTSHGPQVRIPPEKWHLLLEKRIKKSHGLTTKRSEIEYAELKKSVAVKRVLHIGDLSA